MEKVILLSKTCNNINVRQTIFGTQKISREKKSNTVLINFWPRFDFYCTTGKTFLSIPTHLKQMSFTEVGKSQSSFKTPVFHSVINTISNIIIKTKIQENFELACIWLNAITHV